MICNPAVSTVRVEIGGFARLPHSSCAKARSQVHCVIKWSTNQSVSSPFPAIDGVFVLIPIPFLTSAYGRMEYMNMPSILLGLLLAAATNYASAYCWDTASSMYGIPTDVLKAVAKTESSFNANARNKNTNSSSDSGLMQINSAWLPTLKQYGITNKSLQDPCTNLKVGAWILSNNARKYGWNWTAIGAYNVGCAKLNDKECARRRNNYAWKIHKALQQVRKFSPSEITTPNTVVYGDTDSIAMADHHAVPTITGARREQEIARQGGGIMVVRFGEDEDAKPVQTADSAAPATNPASIGSFLNYEDEKH
jgi:hypothetical protein